MGRVQRTAACVSHSSDIVDVLNDMLNKDEAQLNETRPDEANAEHHVAMLKKSLKDQLAQDDKSLKKTKRKQSVCRNGDSRSRTR